KDFASRFVDVLKEMVPNLAILLGEDEFSDLALRYTARHPSRHYDLAHLGEALPDFLSSDSLIEQAPFLADLARAECEIAAAFHHPFLATVEPSALQDFNEEKWLNARFEFQPSLCLLVSEWPLPTLLHVQHMKEEEFQPEALQKGAPSYLLIAQRQDQGV